MPTAAPACRIITKKLADAIAERKAAGMSDDDVDDDDEDSDTAAPADAAAPPIKPYFGANGEATSRATSLPPLPGFETF